MVLAELGKKLSGALRNLQSAPIVDEKVLKQVLNEITIALLQSDVNFKYVKKLKDNITTQFKLHQDSGANLRKMILSSVASSLTDMLSVDKPPFKPKKGKPNVVMFVGLQGSGKTTTCAKYAHYWQRKGFRTCMICADTFRAGAFDQLKQNATKIRVPYHGSYEETDPVEIAREGVELFKSEGFEIIIVDTSGRHKQEDDLFEEMIQVEEAVAPQEIIFVMDSSIGQACYDQALAFKNAVPVGSVIISKLDGHAKGGGALSAVSATESPIRFIGTGEHFTDLEEFEAESFVNRLLGLGDIKKLFQVVKDIMPEDQQNQLMEDIAQGKFTFNTLKQQYGSVLNIGPLNQFMSLIPGIGNQLAGQVSDKEGVAKVKKNLVILASFSEKELQMDKPLEESRMKRIARGAGVTLFDMYMLMEEFKNLKKMIGGLSGLNMGKGKFWANFRK
jgi:signal recognition particle subunit SRP54